MSELEVTEAQKRGCFFLTHSLMSSSSCPGLADITNTMDSEAESDTQNFSQMRNHLLCVRGIFKNNKKYICLYINKHTIQNNYIKIDVYKG